MVRHGLQSVAVEDRTTGAGDPSDRAARTGELVHTIEERSIPAVAATRSWVASRTGSVVHRGLGYTHIHTAIDAYSARVFGCSQVRRKTVNCVAFLERAVAVVRGA